MKKPVSNSRKLSNQKIFIARQKRPTWLALESFSSKFRPQLALLLTATFLSFVLSDSSAVAQASYAVTDLGALGFVTAIGGHALNDEGQVVGSIGNSDGSATAAVYTNGAIQSLSVPGSEFSEALGINDIGEIVGESSPTTPGAITSFIDDNGTYINLSPLRGATVINVSGEVVGFENTSPGDAFLYSNGVVQDIGTPSGPGLAVANSINDKGQVVGQAAFNNTNDDAFLYSNSQWADLGALIGTGGSTAYCINNAGQIVGLSAYDDAGDNQAFIYSGGQMKGLGFLGEFDGIGSSRAFGINNAGQIVGVSTTAISASGDAFIYSAGKMTDLNSLIAASSGWTLTSAGSINNLGQIAAVGTNSAGQTHRLLLTPYTSLNTALVSTVTSAPPIAQFPAPNMLLRQLPNFIQDDGTDFSTPTMNSISLSTQLLGALADPLSNQFLKDFASAAGENLHTAGEVGTIALAATNPNPLAAGASLALMVAPDTLSNFTLKSFLQLPNLVELANYAWGTSGGEPYHAAASLVNFSYGTLLASELEAFGSDPVDPDYQSIVTPAALPDAIAHLPSTGNASVDQAVANSMTSIVSASSYLQAANDSLDKYAGALQGNDPLSAAAQLDAFLQYLVSYNQAAGQSVDDINSLNSLLKADGFTDSSFDPTAFESLQQQIATDGFDPNTTSLLLGMGLTSSDLSLLQSQIASLNPTTLEGDQFGALDSAVAGLSQVTTVPEPSPVPVLCLVIFVLQRRSRTNIV